MQCIRAMLKHAVSALHITHGACDVFRFVDYQVFIYSTLPSPFPNFFSGWPTFAFTLSRFRNPASSRQ